MGDLGNVESKNGVAIYDRFDGQISLDGISSVTSSRLIHHCNACRVCNWLIDIDYIGAYSVTGRSVIIHAGEDDLGRGGHDDSKTTGHAGARVYDTISSSYAFTPDRSNDISLHVLHVLVCWLCSACGVIRRC